MELMSENRDGNQNCDKTKESSPAFLKKKTCVLAPRRCSFCFPSR